MELKIGVKRVAAEMGVGAQMVEHHLYSIHAAALRDRPAADFPR